MTVDANALAREVGKLAKLNAIKNTLPGAMRAAPAAAIAVGAILSRSGTNEDSNFVESYLLGKNDEVTLLAAPDTSSTGAKPATNSEPPAASPSKAEPEQR